jgi:hypothetical protein
MPNTNPCKNYSPSVIIVLTCDLTFW